ncbi:MAG: hypothetical protein J5685_07225 [Clostridiales bacterium]|nr:hypothetical protein [Clostridiales bacterium]
MEKNTYGNYGPWRVLAIILCILFAIIFGVYNSGLFISSYDAFMVREVFRNPSMTADTAGAPLGAFWKWMDFYISGTYGIAALILIFNTPVVNKDRKAGALSDIITYGILALTLPVYFIVSSVASRSFFIRAASFTFGINVAAFAAFCILLVSHLKLYFKNKESFTEDKSDKVRQTVCVAALLVPLIFAGLAIAVAAAYSPNYGAFRGAAVINDADVDNMLFNYYNGAVEYEDRLYFDTSYWHNESHSIWSMDDSGNVTHVIDLPRDISTNIPKLRFDVYGDKIYYVFFEGDVESEVTCSIRRTDINTGTTETLVSEPVETNGYFVVSCETVDMFKIAKGKLYYHIAGADSIYFLDLDNDPFERQFYVSDIRITEDTYDSLTFRFLYNYFYPLGTGWGTDPHIYRGDYLYSIHYFQDGEGADRKPVYYIYKTAGRNDSEKIFITEYIDGECFYDDTFYLYNYEEDNIYCVNIETGEESVISNVAEDDTYYVNGLWIYGDHIVMSFGSDLVVLDR